MYVKVLGFINYVYKKYCLLATYHYLGISVAI